MSGTQPALPNQTPRMRLCLVEADPALEQALRSACEPGDEFTHLRPAEVLDWLRRAEEHALTLEAMLVLYPAHREETAPPFDALVEMPRPSRVSLVALCRADVDQQIAALAAGADEALSLPLHLPLLRARLQARVRALGAPASAPAFGDAHKPHRLCAGPLCVDVGRQVFSLDDVPVELTPKELELIAYLMRNAGTCCTRDQILDHVWGIDFATGTNTVDVYIFLLRKKLKEHGLTGVIRTVRGQGYRFVVPEVQPSLLEPSPLSAS